MLLGLIGVTFAYYTATVKIESKENKTTVVQTVSYANAIMDLGDLITGENVLPGYKVVKPIRVVGNGEKNAQPIAASITLSPSVESFGNHVKYNLYAVDTSTVPNLNEICSHSRPVITNQQYYDAMKCDTTKLGNAILSGRFTGTQKVKKDITVSSNSDTTYFLLIEYENDEKASQDEEQGKSFTVTIGFEASNNEIIYTEAILNGADPILKDNLIPVTIDENGTVAKANKSSEWYNYEKKIWANAIILEDKTIQYNDGEIIPEENIESYFVWIPRYKYRIWNTGNYTGLTSIDNNRIQEIEVLFESREEIVSQGDKVGKYLTHPAFTALDTNGLWVGKFETGYKDAASTAGAEVNSSDASKVVIKPNVYSWRNINVANAFGTSYEYQRELDSHMMKNTEWGAVAYLQHSAYGSRASVRINNNSAYITGYAAVNEPTVGYNTYTDYESTTLGVDGTNTYNYFNPLSVVASTTGNYSGVYDMSGGSWEYVMGVMLNATNTTPIIGGSGFTTFPEAKYYDIYLYNTNTNVYSYGILGDATIEMGPFAQINYGSQKRQIGSWYDDEGWSLYPSRAWAFRGGDLFQGRGAGIYTFGTAPGSDHVGASFRIVIAPK